MRSNCLHVLGSSFLWISLLTPLAFADNISTLQMQFAVTLTDVTITDTVTNNTVSAVFETSQSVGDVLFRDFGPNGSTFTGQSLSSPPGSVGTGNASESILLNGLDPFTDNYDRDSFGIGDSFISTMEVNASAQTPESLFFAQVNSENVLYFGVYGKDTDSFTFHFDYVATVGGTLDSSATPGITLGIGEGNDVQADADTTLSGVANHFFAQSNFFTLGQYNDGRALIPINQQASGSFEVAFAPGDNDMHITFRSSLIVNTGVAAVPEPSSLGLIALAMPFALTRRLGRR